MIQLSGNALKVLESRYLLDNGQRETPVQLFKRVAAKVASAEAKWGTGEDVLYWENIFLEMMARLHFLPNSPTLMNAGTQLNQLSACFVLPVRDDLTSIFDTLKQAALIQQSGGGTGFNFTSLRPHGSALTKTQGTSSGPVSFMKIFDAATGNVKHGGKRRGANMGVLDASHPDILQFIRSKYVEKSLNNFNLSVGVSNAFMEAVIKNADWNLTDPHTQKVTSVVKAAQVWNELILSAWRCGDPGVIFTDTINAANPTPGLGKINCTNPCGEVPLLPYEACNLGSLNLTKFLLRDQGKTDIDWPLLKQTVKSAVRFLDNVIEVNNYLFPEIAAMATGNRKIGLGVMGWAELLMMMQIPYDSAEAINLAKRIMKFIAVESFKASADLAGERGVFANWKKSIYYPASRIRNATRTSIAPTGTISIIADTSSSIEPLFALSFRRQQVLDGEVLLSICEPFVQYLREHNLYTEAVIQQLNRNGTAGGIKELPDHVRAIFKTATEISPSWHLRHQLAFQQYTDNAVSKTINLPEHAAVEDVDEIYREAWRGKAKGITVFRNNCREKQVMVAGIEAKEIACKVCV